MEEEEIVALYRQRAYPGLTHFRRILKDERGVEVSPRKLRRILLEAGLQHAIASRGRQLRFRRQAFASVAPDET